MAKLVFQPIADQITSGTYLLYDGACGTGGMLTVAEETLQELAAEHGKEVATHLLGQEINAETFAICKADLLLKGEGEAADNIVGGPEHSTLSNDANPGREFDFMLSNPPYGKSWKTDLERMGGKREMRDPRFVIEHAGSVVGAPSGAKGEIHSLALSLFCRGYCCRNLPFGFSLIDDPVQAMAPGKVDGLARVFARVAKERQVVVLTHDERLPESACRLQIPAHVIEVVRRLGSQVACGTIGDPVTQSLNDARALLRTGRSARGRHGTSGAAVLPLGHGSGVRGANSTFRGCRS